MIISFPLCMNKKCDEVVINAITSLTYKPFNIYWSLIQRFMFLSLFKGSSAVYSNYKTLIFIQNKKLIK